MKDERTIDRIKQLADWLIGHKVVKSMLAFERLCGLSRMYVRNILATEKGNPGVDVIAKIYDAFPLVSLEWLISGKGTMWKRRGSDDEIAEEVKSLLLRRLI